MKNHETTLREAASRQVYTTFYYVHIFSPLLDQCPPRCEDKKSDSITIRFPSWVREILDDISAEEKISLNQIIKNSIINAVECHLDREECRSMHLNYIKEIESKPPQTSNDAMQTLLEKMKEWEQESPKITNELRQLLNENPDLLKRGDSE